MEFHLNLKPVEVDLVPAPSKDSEKIRISYSQAGVWQSCQMKWYYGYHEGWTPRKEKEYFAAGKFCHEILAVYYQVLQQGGDNDTAMRYALLFAQEAQIDPDDLESFDPIFYVRIIRVLTRYMENAPRWDKGRRILGVEQEGFLPLTTLQGREILLHFIVDLIYASEGFIGVEDHKTMNGKYWWNPIRVRMNAQLGTYSAAVGAMGIELPSGRTVHDVDELSVNMINTHDYNNWGSITNDELFRRVGTRRNKSEELYMLSHFGNIVDEMQDKIEGQKPIMRNLGTHCERCDFRDVCLLDMKGHNVRDLLEVGFKRKTEKDNPKNEKAGSD